MVDTDADDALFLTFEASDGRVLKEGYSWIGAGTLDQSARQDVAGGAAAGVQDAASRVTGLQAEVRLEVQPQVLNRLAAEAREHLDRVGVVQTRADRKRVGGV